MDPAIWPPPGGDGDPEALRRALIQFIESGRPVVVATGRHVVANPIVIRGCKVDLSGVRGSSIEMQDNSAGGIRLERCSSATIQNLSLHWTGSVLGQRKHYGAGILCSECADPHISSVSVRGPPGAGIHFEACYRPRVRASAVLHSAADGVHFANCHNPVCEAVSTDSTGDDGVAFVNYKRLPEATGGLGRGIYIRNSAARGIAIVGQSDVTLEGFLIDGTRASGLFVATDDSYQTRSPRQVQIRKGVVKRAGQSAGRNGNRFGIEVYVAGDVLMESLSVQGSAGRNVSIARTSGIVSLRSLTLCRNDNGEGLHAVDVEQLEVVDLSASDSATTGLYVARASRVYCRGIAFNNSNLLGKSIRTMDLQSIGALDVSHVAIQSAWKWKSGSSVSVDMCGVGSISVVRHIAPDVSASAEVDYKIAVPTDAVRKSQNVRIEIRDQ